MPVATKRPRITRNKLGTTNDDDDDVFAVRKPAAGGKKTPNTTKSDTPTVSQAKPSNNKKQVQSSSSGGPLVGREQEFKDIEEPLVSSLKSGLDVSGVPGTGKTATVRAVLMSILQGMPTRPFDWVEVNGMKVAHPHDVYSLLYNRLSGKKAAPSTAIKRLDRHFQDSLCRHCVLVLDEVDALLGAATSNNTNGNGKKTQQSSVLYRLLEWPGQAPLSIIAIANTMDLPERQLGGRLASRLGMQRVNFTPYTYPQLMRILERRFGSDSAMTADALEYCARKVGAVSGDARRAINLASKAHSAGHLRVGIKEMDAIINSHIASKTPGLCGISLEMRLVLLAIHNMTLSTGVVPVDALIGTCWQLSKTTSTTPIFQHYTDIQRVIVSLLSMGVIMEYQRGGGKCVSLSAIHRDDLTSFLNADPVLTRFVVK